MSQLLEEGRSSYRGRSQRIRVMHAERSAEAIVVAGNEPVQKPEDLQKQQRAEH